MKTERVAEINSLVQNAKIAYVSAVNDEGFPNTKAVLALQRDGLFVHYFSSNLSAKRSQQFIKNPKACVYFCNEAEFKGLMLIGSMQVLTDHEHKAMLWRDGFEIYYPDGIDTEDYCVLKFTGEKGNYYHDLENNDFSREEWENA